MVCGCLADACNHCLALHSHVTVFTRDSDCYRRQFAAFLFVKKEDAAVSSQGALGVL